MDYLRGVLVKAHVKPPDISAGELSRALLPTGVGLWVMGYGLWVVGYG